jgi:hypothetical protein
MGFSLLTNQREARFYGISRKIKGGNPKKTQEIGAFSTPSRKSPENQAFFASKSNRAVRTKPARPDLQVFEATQAASGPAFSVRSVMRADLPVRPRR